MRLGKTFINPAFDLLLIGGVLSLPVALVSHAVGFRFDVISMWQAVLLASSAHVAASLLRLYAKPGVVRQRPVLTVGFPAVMLAATLVVLLGPPAFGKHVLALYLSWSAYHYAAQTFGLATMYTARSGGSFTSNEKTFLHATCLASFVYAVLAPTAGLTLVVPLSVYTKWPPLGLMRDGLRAVLLVVIVVAPLVLAEAKRRRGQPLPLMPLVLVYTNAIWWVIFVPQEAFAWASLSHGIQYVAIASIMYARDANVPGKATTHGGLYHGVTFYAASVALAYGLYYGVPALMGILSPSLTSSAVPAGVAMMLNLHHVVIDGFIWKRAAPRRASEPSMVGLGAPAT